MLFLNKLRNQDIINFCRSYSEVGFTDNECEGAYHIARKEPSSGFDLFNYKSAHGFDNLLTIVLVIIYRCIEA